MNKLTIKQANKITGGIGKTTKTGLSYGLPAVVTCRVGSKLTGVSGSVCEGCYGCKGRYGVPVVRAAQKRRMESIHKLDSQLWVEAMAFLIKRENEKLPVKEQGYFRWHDTGDLMSLEHLDAIIRVAKALPDIKFWLPTKEYLLVNDGLSLTPFFPKNLTIRLSGYMIDEPMKIDVPWIRHTEAVLKNQKSREIFDIIQRLAKLPVSNVHDKGKPLGYACPAIEAHSNCAELGCRRCWSQRTRAVSYKKHS